MAKQRGVEGKVVSKTAKGDVNAQLLPKDENGEENKEDNATSLMQQEKATALAVEEEEEEEEYNGPKCVRNPQTIGLSWLRV